MYNVTRYVIWLTDEDHITMDLGFDAAHELVDGCINYSARIHERWVEVGRYDTAHGVPHVHRFWMSPESIRPLPGMPVREFIDRGMRDFLQHWPKYRARMELKAP